MTRTRVSGGEKCAPFSTSSATRWARSATAEPLTAAGSTSSVPTLEWSSIPASAVRSTSVTAAGRGRLRSGSAPVSTSMLSACRRVRVAVCLSRDSCESTVGLRSAVSSSPICVTSRSTRP